MIWQPRRNQKVRINYKDKSMPLQDETGKVIAVGKGKGPKNALIFFSDPLATVWHHAIIPRGNLNEIITLLKPVMP